VTPPEDALQRYLETLKERDANLLQYLNGPARRPDLDEVNALVHEIPEDLETLWRIHNGVRFYQNERDVVMCPPYVLSGTRSSLVRRIDIDDRDSMWVGYFEWSEQMRSLGKALPVFESDSLLLVLPQQRHATELLLVDLYSTDRVVTPSGLDIADFVKLHLDLLQQGYTTVVENGWIEFPGIPAGEPVPDIDSRILGKENW